MSRPASPPRFGPPPSLAEMVSLAEAVLLEMPAAFQPWLNGLSIRVEEFPDEETLAALNLESPFDLLGLYQGVDVGRQSLFQVRTQPDHVVLYRRPLLDEWCESGEDLNRLVRHVLIHEIGHHFGYSDEEMDAIDRADD